MATTCPADLDTGRPRDEIRSIYTRVATDLRANSTFIVVQTMPPRESVDFVISNGVLNLTPDKRQAFGAVFRILKPGGQFFYGDNIVASELSESIRRDIDLWTG